MLLYVYEHGRAIGYMVGDVLIRFIEPLTEGAV